MLKALQNINAIALMGATGTGKSSLAMRLAQQYGLSIICCDSMQVYRGLDIGTAKASRADQQAVPHFLLDVVDLPAVYSAQQWADDARGVIVEENKRGRLPLIVGGTGMYLRALLDGFSPIPDEKPEVRVRYQQILERDGVAALYQQLYIIDPELAEQLHATDSQRIMRGLCVFESTGKPLSQWQKLPAIASDLDCPVFVLNKLREQLREDIAVRFHQMMDEGFWNEVLLLDKIALPDTHPVMRAVGYRQLLDALYGQDTLEEAVEKGITATRKYAKRQVTWFRNQTPQAEQGTADELFEKISQVLESA